MTEKVKTCVEFAPRRQTSSSTTITGRVDDDPDALVRLVAYLRAAA